MEKAKLRGARAPTERPEDLFAYPLNIARRPTTKQPEAFLWVSSDVVRRWGCQYASMAEESWFWMLHKDRCRERETDGCCCTGHDVMHNDLRHGSVWPQYGRNMAARVSRITWRHPQCFWIVICDRFSRLHLPRFGPCLLHNGIPW